MCEKAYLFYLPGYGTRMGGGLGPGIHKTTSVPFYASVLPPGGGFRAPFFGSEGGVSSAIFRLGGGGFERLFRARSARKKGFSALKAPF